MDALVGKVSVLPRRVNGGEAPQVTRRIDQLTKTVRRHRVSTAVAVLATAVMLLRLLRNQ
jgi:hypothetical protein